MKFMLVSGLRGLYPAQFLLQESDKHPHFALLSTASYTAVPVILRMLSWNKGGEL